VFTNCVNIRTSFVTCILDPQQSLQIFSGWTMRQQEESASADTDRCHEQEHERRRTWLVGWLLAASPDQVNAVWRVVHPFVQRIEPMGMRRRDR